MNFSNFAQAPLPEVQDTKGDLRVFHLIESSPESAEVVIASYPDDQGVKNNGGREGARDAPQRVMKYLLKMTPPGFAEARFPKIGFAGMPEPDLSHFDRLEAGRAACATSLKNGQFWIGLGGGHDYGYCEGAGFLSQNTYNKPLVVNFDAHLDVRPFDKDRITSGTPFFRLLEEFDDFEFLEIGVRDFCNRKEHGNYVKAKGGKILTLEELRTHGALRPAQTLLDSAKGRACFISVDIDVFASHIAMGCSQSWPSGMTLAEFLPIFDFLFKNFEVKALGIYEVSPKLDQDDRTSKLAAEILYSCLVKLNEQ